MRVTFRRILVWSIALGCAAPTAFAAPRARRPASPSGTSVVDDTQLMNVNLISMPVTNTGSFWNSTTGEPALEYPKGSGKTAVFASGLWLAARAGGDVRTTVSGYSDEFRPGAVVAGVPDDPARPEYKVYRLDRHFATTALRDAALADYLAGAVPHGAQGVAVLGDGSLDIAGDEMCWSVYNDLDAAAHTDPSGRTSPLGVEVQQTTFAFDRPGALGSTIYARYRIINRGSQPLEDLRAGLWADPDIGGFSDDLAGSDPSLGMGYCYNGTSTDVVYGATPPAVGFDVLAGPPDDATHQPRPTTATSDITNGGDPTSALESFDLMCGLDRFGNPVVDPTTSLVTTFEHPGDPVANTGWLDTAPGDRRVLVASGPSTLLPGQQIDVVVAIVAARGADRLGSVSLLRSYDAQAQTEFDSGTLIRLETGAEPPPRFTLERTWPNPARGAISVAFSLPDASPASLDLVDVAGRRIAHADVGTLGSGRHVVRLVPEATRLPAGLYLVRLERGGRSRTAKVVLAH